MRRILFLASVLVASGIAFSPAAARIDTDTMTCRQLIAFVAARGAVVMHTGTHTYKRFVAHRGYCMVSERLQSAWAPTVDGSECRLRECDEPLDFRSSRGRGTGK